MDDPGRLVRDPKTQEPYYIPGTSQFNTLASELQKGPSMLAELISGTRQSADEPTTDSPDNGKSGDGQTVPGQSSVESESEEVTQPREKDASEPRQDVKGAEKDSVAKASS
ncbi:hypothetical protein NLJ89_g2297 [Agrocybe chaxingu]|uniref:Uncharacterized protein n=1 Tax=Agrocybe chaxingu TaxID=84603 RepID=A0A9W8KCE9_9AGAR|nr:hypothetical protein NLJ89_g2297 [Agrocybe chaxingu]